MQQRMTITLNQAAIETALVDYITKMGVDTSGKSTEVSLTAGRKENGYSADVTVITVTGTEPTKPVVQAAPVSQPEPEEEEAEEVVEEASVEAEEATEEEPKPKKAANLFGG